MQHNQLLPASGFRPIMPRVGRGGGGDDEPPARQPTSVSSASGKGPLRSSVACEACRRKKVKCDAVRPTCSACSLLGVGCVYRTAPSESSMSALKRKYGDLEAQVTQLQSSQDSIQQLFQAIRTRPEGDASDIFKKLRSGADIDSILRHVRAGDLLVQLHVTPQSNFRFEFPLKIDMPKFLQTHDNPYLQSLMYEAEFTVPESAPARSAHLTENQQSPQYVKPFFSATIVDPRLDAIKPSRFTEVSKDDALMQRLLRSYFSHEHHFMGSLHQDDFIDDMLAGTNEYCTPLLVNAVLALACHSYQPLPDRSKYWDPQTLGYRFFAEAKRLWELEYESKKSLATVQAALIFNNLFNVNCVDKIGHSYKDYVIATTHELGFYDVAPESKGKGCRDSKALTLWALLFWTSMQDFHFRACSPNSTVPPFPLPDPDESPEWYGEFWIKYPLDRKPRPVQYGHLFKAKSELAVIIHGICNKLFRSEKHALSLQRASKIAASYIRELHSWFDALPESLLPKNIVFPAQLQLHILYHDVLGVMCETVLADTISMPPIIPTPYTQSILSRTKNAFETLIRLYYLRHGFEGCDCYLIQDLQVLAHLAHTRLKSLTSSNTATTPSTLPSPSTIAAINDARATLFLAAKGLHMQGKNYYLARTLSYVLQNDLRPEEADSLYKYTDVVREDGIMNQLRLEPMQADYPVWIRADNDRTEKMRGLGEVLETFEALGLGDGEGEVLGGGGTGRSSISASASGGSASGGFEV